MGETSAGKLDSKAAVIPRRFPNRDGRDGLAGCTPHNYPAPCAGYVAHGISGKQWNGRNPQVAR